eukprot:1156924-Pelagomonas_calceolata.AAC.18
MKFLMIRKRILTRSRRMSWGLSGNGSPTDPARGSTENHKIACARSPAPTACPHSASPSILQEGGFSLIS